VNDDPARARRYAGLFDGSNEAERIFLRELPVVTAYGNTNIRRRGGLAEITKAEVGINFITEGGFFALNDNLLTGLSAFGSIGVDNYVGNREVYRSWVPADVDQLAGLAAHRDVLENERAETVSTLTDLTLEQGLYLSAGVFAYSSWVAERTISEFGTLPLLGKFFWRTVFFNAGNGTATRLYRQHGVAYHERGWTGGANNRNPRFNATWRTRSLQLLLQQLGRDFNR
jgi:hypothetical protein